jgi:predicted peptidase
MLRTHRSGRVSGTYVAAWFATCVIALAMGALVVAPLLNLNRIMNTQRFTTSPGQERGVLFREITINGQIRKYAIIVPRAYDGATAIPAILFLHGAGEVGSDGSRQLLIGLAPAMLADPERWPAIAIFPQLPDGGDNKLHWRDEEQAVMAMLDATRREWNIDPARIYLTGLSRGGAGTWFIASRHPDLFAAAMPVCGYGDPAEVAPTLTKLPIWAFHGMKDDVVTPDKTRAIVEAIEAAGGSVKTTYFPEANHNAWDPTYRDPATAQWLFEQKKGGGS